MGKLIRTGNWEYYKLVKTLHHVCGSPRLLDMEGNVKPVLGVGGERLTLEC